MSTTDTTAQVPSPRRDMGPEEAVDTAIDEACRALHLPTIRSRVQDMAAEAMRQRSSYKDFLADLLEAECAERDERRKQRLVRDANFPRPKRLEDFDFAENPNVTPELVVRRQPNSVLAESYRQVATAILPELDQREAQTVLLVGGLPTWGYHSYGYGPSGLLGVVLLILLILLLTGRL